ncbi:MAG: hypothetical protein L3J80_05030, partial [Thermoplasmata archaeon]|nr:hypothetical protein [Thermoplasmata archaeon]
MPNEAPARPSVIGLTSSFGKARSMVFPRSILAGHGVLPELGSMCRQFDFPDRGAVITGSTTVTLAGRRAAEILNESKFDVATIIAH